MQNLIVSTKFGSLTIRNAEISDAEQIMHIYNQEIQYSLSTLDLTPKSIQEQKQWIEKHSGAYSTIVGEITDEIVGFAAISKYRDRAAYASTVEDSIYINTKYRGHGLGRILLTQLISETRALGFHAMIARIVSKNQPSIKLHKNLGFEFIGREKEVGRKFGKWLDVDLYELILN